MTLSLISRTLIVEGEVLFLQVFQICAIACTFSYYIHVHTRNKIKHIDTQKANKIALMVQPRDLLPCQAWHNLIGKNLLPAEQRSSSYCTEQEGWEPLATEQQLLLFSFTHPEASVSCGSFVIQKLRRTIGLESSSGTQYCHLEKQRLTRCLNR